MGLYMTRMVVIQNRMLNYVQNIDMKHRHQEYHFMPSFKRFADIPWPSSEDWEAACESDGGIFC